MFSVLALRRRFCVDAGKRANSRYPANTDGRIKVVAGECDAQRVRAKSAPGRRGGLVPVTKRVALLSGAAPTSR